MAEDLVPTGGDYGTRQQTVANMQSAGVPLQSSPAQAPAPAGRPAPAAGQPPPPDGAPVTGLDLLLSHTPDEFGFLGQPETAQPAGQQDSPLVALAQSAQSTFGLAVLSRLNQRR